MKTLSNKQTKIPKKNNKNENIIDGKIIYKKKYIAVKNISGLLFCFVSFLLFQFELFFVVEIFIGYQASALRF